MAVQTADSTLIVDSGAKPGDVWCAYEHSATLEAGKPPSVIFVSACRLVDVYKLTEGKTNSDWSALFERGGQLLVRIIATGDKVDVIKHAQRHARSLPTLPRCNLHGINVRGARRAVLCHQNGRTYATQREASDELGLSQSAISQHLDGKLTAVRGYSFEYTSRRD